MNKKLRIYERLLKVFNNNNFYYFKEEYKKWNINISLISY